MIREKLALKEQIDSLKQNLSKQIKEKESLFQTFTVFKNESKEKENKYIDTEIDLEKKIKELDNIICKVGQSAQIVHMLTKPQAFYDNTHKQALEEESRSKMSEKKAKDPEVIQQKISHKPIDYEKLNRLIDDFGKRFSPQQELSVEQAFWSRISNPSIEPSYTPPVIVDVPSELPKVSLVNASLKKFKFHLTQFDSMVKKRTTPSALEEAEWGFERTKAVFNNEIIPFLKSLKDIFNVFDKDLLNEIIEELLVYVRDTCPNAINLSAKNVVVTPKDKVKKVRLKCSTSKCISKPIGNKKNDRISQTTSRNMKNKVEAQSRKVNKKNHVVEPIHDINVNHSLLNVNSEPICANCRTFTIVGNSCHLTRITLANVVPPKKTTSDSVETQKPELNVYSMKPKNVKNVGSSKQSKIVESKNANHSEPNHTWGSNAIDIPYSSSLVMTVRFRNGNIVINMGYGDYQLGNVTISRVYYVEGLGHNLFSVGQFCDADLEVGFQKNTCFIRNLEGFDLLSGSRDKNLYTISLDDMLKTSPICLLSKASNTKSWLWHHRLSHLNFGTINKLAKDGLAQGIPRLKFQKDHLCSACVLGKSKKSFHQPKAKDTNQARKSTSGNGIMTNVGHHALKLLSRASLVDGDLGKFDAKVDIGIFVAYAPAKKAFRIYNRRTRILTETIHVTFDELTIMASEQFSSGPGLHGMTPVHQYRGLSV
ncbi:retrovirus-related pol polyprotein from transposon TNT 1-94 [Tanacetum coccineum]